MFYIIALALLYIIVTHTPEPIYSPEWLDADWEPITDEGR